MNSLCSCCGSDQTSALPFHYIWDNIRYDGVRCRECKLARLQPMPSAPVLTALYGNDYFDHALHGLDQAGVTYETLRDEQQSETLSFVRDEIVARVPGAKSLFEIGAAMGHTLDAGRSLGLRCGGLEISATAAVVAKRKFGFELIQESIDQADLSDEQGCWDIVYAGDVLEHMVDPADMLARMAGLLTPGGAVVIRVPATLNLLSTRLATPWLNLIGASRCLPDGPYHLHEFEPATLQRLASRYFKSVTIEQSIVPASRLNIKGGSLAYRLKRTAHRLNEPLTRRFGVCGDRLVMVGRL